MERTISVTGTLAAQERSILSAKVSGRLQAINVDIGSRVAKGDLLAQIEPRDYELRVQQATAALAQARAALGLDPGQQSETIRLEDVSIVKQARAVLQEAANNRERVKRLFESGIAPQSELDTAEATYTVALTRHETALEEAQSRIATVAQRQAELELARKQLSDTELRAPFGGSVQSRPAGVGEYVAAGTPTIELVKTEPLRLRVNIPERFATRMRSGQPLRLLTDGETNHLVALVSRISPALDESNRMLLVEADVPAGDSLRVGLFARAELVLSSEDSGLAVPQECLLTFAGLEKVVIVQNGQAVERVVTTGRRAQGWVEIISGLAAGDQVVVKPSGLRTGSPVTVRGSGPSNSSAQVRATSS